MEYELGKSGKQSFNAEVNVHLFFQAKAIRMPVGLYLWE